MKRNVYSNLLDWKNDENHKPLILLGARQVGKTYILKEFARNEFDNYVYVNCHLNKFVDTLFEDFDIERIISAIELHYEVKIEDGKTLLIFDEIQEIKNGVASLKYFCENRRSLHVVVAGSLLGITLHSDESYPVGKVTTIKMYPMSFSEFLLAKGRTQLLDVLEKQEWNLVNVEHNVLVRYLREYYITGGMPEAVQKYIMTQDVKAVRDVQLEILDAYLRDMSKHTKTQYQRISQVWNSIPTQLSRENKKFIFGTVKKGARAADFEVALQWLLDAGLIYKVERLRDIALPLNFYADESIFKVYMLDCGLLAAMFGVAPKNILLGDNVFSEYKGAFTENFVLQQIVSESQKKVFYYSKESSTQEVDFIVQKEDEILPIEAKAEENVKSKSLASFVKEHNLKGVRCSMKPYIDQGWMENIPLYAAGMFTK